MHNFIQDNCKIYKNIYIIIS